MKVTNQNAMASSYPALRGALGFCLGGPVVLLLMLAKGTPQGPLLPILGFFVPGLIGPLLLAPFLGGWWRTVRTSMGFGFGSLFAGLSFILMLFEVPAKVAWIPCLALGFGLVGAVGGAFMALGWPVFFGSAAGFAIGGAAGAVALVTVQATISRFLLHSLGSTRWSGSLDTVDFISFGITGILLPYVVGGALLGRTLAAHRALKGTND